MDPASHPSYLKNKEVQSIDSKSLMKKYWQINWIIVGLCTILFKIILHFHYQRKV